MRVIVVSRPGGPEVLVIRDVPIPEPGPGDIRVRVRAFGVNRADLLQRRGHYPAPRDAPADIPGLEFAGEVDRAGPGVAFQPGDRVMGIAGGGTYAQHVIVPDGCAVPIPAGLTWPVAAAVPEAFVTAHDALCRGDVRGGAWVLIAGRLDVGDAVEVLPGRIESRIRGNQVYGAAVESARVGQRTAINLQGVEKSAIERGNVLTRPGLLEPSYLMDARLSYLKGASRPLANRTRVRLHLGTSETLARVILLGRAELAPGEEAMVQFRLESPGVALPRDRFVIRGYSPVVTLGGGELVDTRPGKHRQYSPAALEHVETMAGARSWRRSRT